MQTSRMDLVELKAQIVKRVGVERSKKYFFNLNRFVSNKLSKSEFDISCFRLLGRENLPLHNQFIRSMLRNAMQGKTAPPVYDASKSLVQTLKSSSREDGHELGSVGPVSSQNQHVPTMLNGVFSASSRKVRTRDHKFKDRPSPLGPNGKVECVRHKFVRVDDNGNKTIVENGERTPCDYDRPVEQLHPVAELPENEVEQGNNLTFSRSNLLAPLGIPFCSASVGGARKAAPVASTGEITCCYGGGLSDTETLRKRMEQIAAMEGIAGVSMDCANELNNTLDLYLMRLIRSCINLVGSRSNMLEARKHPVSKQQARSKTMNGLWSGYHLQEQRPNSSISLLDFKVAMELNPSQLGEDWPSLLEKISVYAFEE